MKGEIDGLWTGPAILIKMLHSSTLPRRDGKGSKEGDRLRSNPAWAKSVLGRKGTAEQKKGPRFGFTGRMVLAAGKGRQRVSAAGSDLMRSMGISCGRAASPSCDGLQPEKNGRDGTEG